MEQTLQTYTEEEQEQASIDLLNIMKTNAMLTTTLL